MSFHHNVDPNLLRKHVGSLNLNFSSTVRILELQPVFTEWMHVL